MKKVYRPKNFIWTLFNILAAILFFIYFENMFIKYIVPCIHILAAGGLFINAFEEERMPKSKFSKKLDDIFEKEKFFECQHCEVREKIPLNTRKESKLYITNNYLGDGDDFELSLNENKGLHKYPMLCFKCGYVSYWAEYYPPKNYPEYFEVFKLNAKLKTEFIDFAKENNHSEKLEMIKLIEV